MSNRILMVLTSHDDLGGVRPTGFYVPEAAHPYRVFTERGFAVDFASPKGGSPPMDGFDAGDREQVAFLEDPDVTRRLGATLTPEKVKPADYSAVFFVGGHGTMWDFPADTRLQRIAAEVFDGGGVVAAVCHGPAALIDVRLANGAYLVAGRDVAAFTDEEERTVGLDMVVPFSLAQRLIERGARHTQVPAFQAHVVTDSRLVTGQNPASATGTAEALVEAITSANAPAEAAIR